MESAAFVVLMLAVYSTVCVLLGVAVMWFAGFMQQRKADYIRRAAWLSSAPDVPSVLTPIGKE